MFHDNQHAGPDLADSDRYEPVPGLKRRRHAFSFHFDAEGTPSPPQEHGHPREREEPFEMTVIALV
jgi:hypothetical protein